MFSIALSLVEVLPNMIQLLFGIHLCIRIYAENNKFVILMEKPIPIMPSALLREGASVAMLLELKE